MLDKTGIRQKSPDWLWAWIFLLRFSFIFSLRPYVLFNFLHAERDREVALDRLATRRKGMKYFTPYSLNNLRGEVAWIQLLETTLDCSKRSFCHQSAIMLLREMSGTSRCKKEKQIFYLAWCMKLLPPSFCFSLNYNQVCLINPASLCV